MRERIFSVASLWIGRPCVVHLHRDVGEVRCRRSRSTSVTLPTFTPAIRTGRVGPQVVRGLEHRVELERVRATGALRERRSRRRSTISTIASAPARKRVQRGGCGRRRAVGGRHRPPFTSSRARSSVSVPWLPGALPITCLPRAVGLVAGLALPSGPARRVRVRVRVQVVGVEPSIRRRRRWPAPPTGRPRRSGAAVGRDRPGSRSAARCRRCRPSLRSSRRCGRKRHVVADGLRRRDVADRRGQRLDRLRQVLEADRHDRVLREVLQDRRA